MYVSPEALKQWDKLCPSKSLVDLRRMVKHSAPVSNPKGNKRYKDFVFNVKGKQIVGVTMIHAITDCEFCGGRGFTVMVDDFTELDVQIPCHECGEKLRRR